MTASEHRTSNALPSNGSVPIFMEQGSRRLIIKISPNLGLELIFDSSWAYCLKGA